MPAKLEMSDVWAVQIVFSAYVNVHLEQYSNLVNAYWNERFLLVLLVILLKFVLELQIVLMAFANAQWAWLYRSVIQLLVLIFPQYYFLFLTYFNLKKVTGWEMS